MSMGNYVLVCGSPGCGKVEPAEIFKSFQTAIESAGLQHRIQVIHTGCYGLCTHGPVVQILPDDIMYVGLKSSDVQTIVTEHFINGTIVERFVYADSDQQKKSDARTDAYRKQYRIVLRNCGVINPDSIDEYIARDGYASLEKVLFDMTQEDVISELKKSGLRGRGGAGYPTWMKWDFTRKVNDDVKYIVCNADEGDPGAYMDRSTLEGDPHSVLEAMTIAGKVVGGYKGFVYIRAEYPLAITRLQNAIQQSHEYGLLGDDILGSGFSFDIELRFGAGAFVCGEETALLASVEGSRGMPRPRPPYPAVKGLWNKPTVINNVETLANIPVILLKGGDWFSRIGTATSKGTKVFALTGKIENSGLIEVPMGITLREIVYDIGGGIRKGKQFKAAQSGGPSGGVLPAEYIDTKIDYENLSALGSIMGSGGLIIMDEDDCMVDVAKFYLEFTVDESCGKCAPCRVGGKQLHKLVEKISEGRGEMDDIQKMKDICLAMKTASLCGLGQTAPNPVMSTLTYFFHEYEEHIKDGRCRAGKCKGLLKFEIVEGRCIGCGLCAIKCPVKAISGEKKKPYVIDQSKCIKCGACLVACRSDAVEKK